MAIEHFVVCRVISLQLIANILVFVGVNVCGLFLVGVSDSVQRKSFSATWQCAKARLEIQHESDKQVGVGFIRSN